MENIFAPWRMTYILASKDQEGCIFCDFPKENRDEERLILHRGKTCFIILNAFPYNPGHLMVAPYRHVDSLDGLQPGERAELMELANRCVVVLKKIMQPQGFNIGLNLGAPAGAGLKDHLHLHVVPRWNGDTNFMPVLGKTTVIPQALDELYDALKPHFI